jgi:hypothetical protein
MFVPKSSQYLSRITPGTKTPRELFADLKKDLAESLIFFQSKYTQKIKNLHPKKLKTQLLFK